MRIIICSLFLLVVFGTTYTLALTPNQNFGAMFSQVPNVKSALQKANQAFIGLGCLIIMCSVITNIKNASDGGTMLFAIVNPLILCVMMGISMDGNAWGNPGLCTVAGNLGDQFAGDVNPTVYPGGVYNGNALFAAGGGTPTLGDIWNGITNNADKVKAAVTNDPSGKNQANEPAAAKEDYKVEAKMGAIQQPAQGSTNYSGNAFLGALLGLVYLCVFGIVEIACIILMAVSGCVVNIMLTIRLFLLLLSSVFLPLFIAALSLQSTRGIGQNYIMSCICLASWPIGWAAGHIGTLALIAMAWSNVTTLENNPASISTILSAGLLLLLCPFWIIVVTLSGPFAACKMITTGANFASSIMTSSLQMQAQMGGKVLEFVSPLTIIPGAGMANTSTDCDCGGKSGEEQLGSDGVSALANAPGALIGAIGGGGGGEQVPSGATEPSVSGAADDVGADMGTPESSVDELSVPESVGDSDADTEAGGDGDHEASLIDGDQGDSEGDGDQESSIIEDSSKSDDTKSEDTGKDDMIEGVGSATAVATAMATSGKGGEKVAKKGGKSKLVRKFAAGSLSKLGTLLTKASKFDGSPESLVRSGVFDLPEPKKESSELAMLKEIRDELTGLKSSAAAMKDIGVDPKKKALGPVGQDGDEDSDESNDSDNEKGTGGPEGEVVTGQSTGADGKDPIPGKAGTGGPEGTQKTGQTIAAEGSDETRGSTNKDGKKKPGKVRKFAAGSLKLTGTLLQKASKFDGSPESLVKSGLFEFPEPHQESKEYAVMTEIRDSLKEASKFAMNESQINPNVQPSPEPDPVPEPVASAPGQDPLEDPDKPKLGPRMLNGLGNLLKKASNSEDPGDRPDPRKDSEEKKMLKEIRNQIKNLSPSVKKALADVKSNDNS